MQELHETTPGGNIWAELLLTAQNRLSKMYKKVTFHEYIIYPSTPENIQNAIINRMAGNQ